MYTTVYYFSVASRYYKEANNNGRSHLIRKNGFLIVVEKHNLWLSRITRIIFYAPSYAFIEA